MKIYKTGFLFIAVLLSVFTIAARGANPSYVFWSDASSTYLTKYDGSNMIHNTITFNASAPLAGLDGSNRKQSSSGSGVSLLTYYISSNDTPAYSVDPGTYGYEDACSVSISPLSWVSPAGRHGGLDQYNSPMGMIQAGIYRVKDDLAKTMISSQNIVKAEEMGDFQSDIFSDDSGQTYIARHDGSSVQLLNNEPMVDCVIGGYGAVASFTTAGTYYIKPDGTMVSVYSSSLINSIGGKAGKYGFFNAGGRARYVDGDNDSVYNYYTSPMTAFVRVGECALTSSSTSTHLFNSRTRTYTSWVHSGTITDGISFGDYALVVINSQTYILRDNGSNTGVDSVDYQLFTADVLDLSKATGGHLTSSTGPVISADIAGDDGIVNINDFAVFSDGWLDCYNPEGCN